MKLLCLTKKTLTVAMDVFAGNGILGILENFVVRTDKINKDKGT